MVQFRVAELTPTALAAGQVGSGSSDALMRAGAAAQTVADGFTEHYENKARIERERLLAQTQADWSRTFSERAKDAGPGFAKSMVAEYQQYVATALQTAPQRGRENLELAFDKYKLDLETRAIEAEAQARARAIAKAQAEAKKARAQALASQKRMAGNRLISDPSSLQEFVEADPENADYYTKIALDARMMDDPVSVRDEVMAGKWDARLSPSEKLAFAKAGAAAVERAQREAEIALKVQRDAYGNELAEDLAYAEANGTPPVDAAFDPELVLELYQDQAPEVIARYEQAVQHSETVYQVRTAAPDVLQAQLSELVTAVQERGDTKGDVQRLQSFQAAVEARNKAITDDASAYVVGVSDEAGAYFNAYSGAEAEDRPIAARDYVSSLNANYDALGVPDSLRRVLPKAVAQQVANAFNDMAPDVAAQSLRDYRNEWGQNASRVMAELGAADLAPEYLVAMRHADNPGLAAAIVNLRGQDTKTLKTGLDTLSVTDMERELTAQLAEYRSAFEAGDPSGRAAELFNLNYGVGQRLALQYMRTGLDPAVAVEKVTTQLFPETPVQTGDKQILVPAQYDPNQVERALDQAMEIPALRGADLMPLDDPRLPEFADMEVMLEAAQNGVWLNNSTGDGAVLHLNIGGYYLPLMRKDGQLYDVKFADSTLPQNYVNPNEVRQISINPFAALFGNRQ
jgi:hypothetical protein